MMEEIDKKDGLKEKAKKYREENYSVYQGMVNAFDIVAKTKDKKEETERNLQRFEVKSKLLMDRFQHPVKPNDREMITCAYYEKMEELKDERLKNYQSRVKYDKYMTKLENFGKSLGIEQKKAQTPTR